MDGRAQIAAAMLDGLRRGALQNASGLRERQRHFGFPVETRADYAEGAAGAYAIAASVLAGAYGVTGFDAMAVWGPIEQSLAREIALALRQSATALAQAAKLDAVSLVPLDDLAAGDHYAMPTTAGEGSDHA